jgi:hypothetical protein
MGASELAALLLFAASGALVLYIAVGPRASH